MTGWHGLLVLLGVSAAGYALFVAWLALSGRREDARALAGLVPDCIGLLRRLLADPRVPRRSKVAILAAVGYLAMPFDLVPDVIPVAGQLDDLLLVALVLRSVLRAGGPELLREHWHGPVASRDLINRLVFGSSA